MKILQQIFDWSEVWALLIPLAVLFKFKKQPKEFKSVIIYLWLALIIDFVIDAAWKFKVYFPEKKHVLPTWIADNNYLYNVHSIVRFICFSSFFILLRQPYQQKLKKVVPYIALLFVLINFLFLNEDFFQKGTFSSRLLATEAGLLLFYCLQYFLFHLKNESFTFRRTAEFWIVLGLSIYVVINFFIFLFYKTLMQRKLYDTLASLWNIHNVTFIIFCIFIAKAFHVSRHN